MKYFEPDDRPGVCVSLEEWGAWIFTPDIPQILHDAKIEDKKTKEWFKRSKRLEGHFSSDGRDLLSKNVKGVNNKEDGAQKSAGVETSYNSSDQHQGQPKEELFYNISCGIKLLLNKFEENSKKKRGKLKMGNRMITKLHKRLLHLCYRL